MTHLLHIHRWHPARINQWEGRHWSVKAKLKQLDKDMIAGHLLLIDIPKAHGPRRVTLTITLTPRQRRSPDVDAYWKSLLDALVHCQLLIDDSPRYVTLAPVQFIRGSERATSILLEDL